MQSEPETRVPPGQEEQALQTHVKRMAQWVARRQIKSLLSEFYEEERARRKLLKISLVFFALLLGAFALFVFDLSR